MTGALGVHDFYMKRNKLGVWHIIIFAIAGLLPGLFAWPIYAVVWAIIPDLVGKVSGFVLIVGFATLVSYTWAIIEGIRFSPKCIKEEEKKEENASDEDKIKLENGNNSDINNIYPGQGIYPEPSKANSESAQIITREEITEEEAKKLKKYDRSWQATISFVATIIIIVIWLSSLFASGGETNEGKEGGAVWWGVVAFYMTIGLPLTAVSLGFGIAGLKTKEENLARFSIFLTILTPVAVFIIVAIRSFFVY